VSGRIQSIERAVAVLRLLGAAPQDLALQEIAESLELPKPTTHGIVATLRHVGLIQQNHSTGRYRLVGELAGLPGSGVDPHVLRSQSMNWADSLAANTGEAVLIGIPASDRVEIIHHVFCPDGSLQRLLTGESRPVHATALGKVLLAHTSWLGSRARLMPLERYTGRTTTTRTDLDAEVREIRTAGYSVEVGEYQGETSSVAAPIRVYGGLAVGAIAVLGPTHRVLPVNNRPRRDITERVVFAAHAISDQLEELR
jgi:DNA-binding IclR family transcriptional regulator